MQFIVAGAWTSHFSLAHDTISDLGNTACGIYGKMYVCSPEHGWMNASFMLLGFLQAIGAVLLYRKSKNNLTNLGFDCMFLSGVGSLLVGLHPENVSSGPHIAGATLVFLLGNIGLVLLGLSLKMPLFLKRYTLASGYIALAALSLFVNHKYLGIGIGGMERFTAYPQTIWLVVFGFYTLRMHSDKYNS